MSLEESMTTLAESNLKLAAALNGYATTTIDRLAATGGVAFAGTTAAAGNADEAADEAAPAGKKPGRRTKAEIAADAKAEAAQLAADAKTDSEEAEKDPFGDDEEEQEEAAPVLTAESIRELVLKVKAKSKDHALALLKKLGVATLAQITEKDYPKVVELAAKVGVTP